MSSLEDLYVGQREIFDALKTLFSNFKKDGQERKTVDYFKRRLNTLEGYWGEYQSNHLKICEYKDERHPYFAAREFEKVKDYYETIKSTFQEQLREKQMREQSENTNPSVSQQTEKLTGSKLSDELKRDQQVIVRDESKNTESRASLSKSDEMLKKQAINFKAFIRTVESMDVDQITDKWEFEDALRCLQNRWTVIDSLHWEIDNELNGDNMDYEITFTKHERTYNKLKKDINSKMFSVVHREKATPQMEIPVFHGNYLQWVSFRDLFNEAIHKNSSLSNAQKMQFLKSKVKGEAERLIQHLPISSENYEKCWEILKNRFGNKKLIFTTNANILLGLPNMQQQAWGQIKKIHDTTLECLHAINNLGVDTSTWDPILVHILSQKLDRETYEDYIESLKNKKELPVLKEFIEYLESKFTMLETSRSKQENPSTSKSNNHQNQSFTKKSYQYENNFTPKPYGKSFHVSANACPFCNQRHGLFFCNKFLQLSDEVKLKTIHKLNVCVNCLYSHQGKTCISSKTCRKCFGNHNTLLHHAIVKTTPSGFGANVSKPSFTSKNQEKGNITSHVAQENLAEILLSTALVKVTASDGSQHVMRALIDGGSQISLIKESAAQQLGLKRKQCRGVIFGVGEQQNNCKGMMNITCTSMHNDFTFNSDVLIMNNLIKNLPSKSFLKPSWKYIESVKLADPEFFISRPVDLLLGADIYSTIMLGGILKGEDATQPLAQQTHLGWLLCGSINTTFQCNVILNHVENIHKFWEIEDITKEPNVSSDEQKCIDYYNSTTIRRQDGRYEVRIPFQDDFEKKLGPSKQMAIAQFKNMENKFMRQPKLAEDYRAFMNEYQTLQHMKPSVKDSTSDCYLPHHAVQRPESITTKTRVVFNGSFKTSSGYSQNDLMHKGPNLQQDLQSLLLKWRKYQYGYTADVEKMFRMVFISDVDQKYQKIIWRKFPDQPLQSYQLTTITYGTKAAPFLAMMTLKRLAADERQRYPAAAGVVEESFYCDDLVHGSHSIEDGKQIIKDIDVLLKSGGFKLRKWASNAPELLDNIQNNASDEKIIFHFKSEDTSKTLGLQWRPTDDMFTFECTMSKETPSRLTKRKLLAEISKVFDPLGWLAPITTKLKLLFQNVWLSKITWDDTVSDEVYNEWVKIRSEMDCINQMNIPRWMGSRENGTIEIHGFSDSSEKCYACVVYALTRYQDQTSITLLAAKTRLVPNKKAVSLPRLELSGAQLLSKLIAKIKDCLQAQNIQLYCWSDSMVVLGWIKGDPGRWKPFVANRVKSICAVTSSDNWRYVNTSENPADAASRGLLASQLQKHALWWQGPQWLKSFSQNNNLKNIQYNTEEELKTRQTLVLQNNDSQPSIISELLLKHNSLRKIVRVLAWILRACAPRSKQKPSYITLQELNKAKSVLIKHAQRSVFAQDIEYLQKHKTMTAKSDLLKLNAFLDEQGILRARGRLANADISFEKKCRIIIPHESQLTGLLINDAHHLTYHGGVRLTLANLIRCLNSRPLCALSEDVDDIDFLSPSHFLQGRAGTTIIETGEDARTRWHLINRLFQDIWKRWKGEYLLQLSSRSKWLKTRKNMIVGDIVIIHEENLPAGKWAMGRVTEVHPGADGIVRVVTLKTKNGYFKRPVSKLSLLPLENTHTSAVSQSPKELNKKAKSSSVKQKVTNFVSMAISLIFFMTIISSSEGQQFSLTQLPINQGLYFDPISKIQIIRDKWTLVVYYDMSPYWTGVEAYSKLSVYLNSTCSKIEQQINCNIILLQLHQTYQELQYYNERLLRQHFNENARQRRRRGLINAVGNLANTLFGVLDNQFAEKYTQDIKSVRDNERYLVKLWQNQTSVVEAEFNLLKRMENSIEKQHKLIHKQLYSLEATTNILQTEIRNLSNIQDFTLTALAGSNLLQTLKQLQEVLLDTITDIYNGRISPHILTPTQLKAELQIISMQAPKELTLPISNLQSNIQQLYKLLRLKTRVTNEYVIFEITFPLVSRDTYQLYQAIAVPSQYQSNMLTITPISQYVAINLHRDSYIIMNINELQACLLQEDTYVCQLQKPVNYLQHDKDLCVNKNTEICKVNQNICKNQWKELNTPSQYLYFCCDTYTVKIVCGDHITVKQLTGAGIITLNQNCIVKGKEFTLHSQQLQSNKVYISPNIETPKIDQINHIINITISRSEAQDDKGIINQTLAQIGESIEGLKSETSEVDMDQLSSHDIHQYTIGYGAMGIAVSIILVWLYRRRHRVGGWSCTRRPAAAAATSASSNDVCDVLDNEHRVSENIESVSARVFNQLSDIRLSKRKIDKSTSPKENKRHLFQEESGV